MNCEISSMERTSLDSLGISTPDETDRLRIAFLRGAKHWEFHKESESMRPSDQKEVWEEACRRYPKTEEQKRMKWLISLFSRIRLKCYHVYTSTGLGVSVITTTKNKAKALAREHFASFEVIVELNELKISRRFIKNISGMKNDHIVDLIEGLRLGIYDSGSGICPNCRHEADFIYFENGKFDCEKCGGGRD